MDTLIQISIYIPVIVLIELILFWLFLRKITKINVNLALRGFFAVALANIVSFSTGGFLPPSLDVIEAILIFIVIFVVSTLIEWGIYVLVFIKSGIERFNLLKISFLVNLIGSVVIFFILFGPLIWQQHLDRDARLSKEALKNLDVRRCEEVQSPDKRNKCYRDLAIKTKDSSLCEKIEGVSFVLKELDGGQGIVLATPPPNIINRDNCYTSVAIAKGDLSLCGKVKGPLQITNCINAVGYILNPE